MGTGRGSFLGVKRPGREVNYSPPSNAENKSVWSYTSAPPLRLYAVGRETLQYHTFAHSLFFYTRSEDGLT
jgi:hypothetical protein